MSGTKRQALLQVLQLSDRRSFPMLQLLPKQMRLSCKTRYSTAIAVQTAWGRVAFWRMFETGGSLSSNLVIIQSLGIQAVA